MQGICTGTSPGHKTSRLPHTPQVGGATTVKKVDGPPANKDTTHAKLR